MAIYNFPSFPPTQRRGGGGTIPIAEFKSRNGTIYRRQLSSIASEVPYELVYRNVPDTWLSYILTHYRDAGAARFKLDQASTTKGIQDAGTTTGGQTWRVFPDQNVYSWVYDGEPTWESVAPGYSNITVKLKAVIDT